MGTRRLMVAVAVVAALISAESMRQSSRRETYHLSGTGRNPTRRVVLIFEAVKPLDGAYRLGGIEGRGKAAISSPLATGRFR